ncbi:MAG: hypothetical protein WCF93_05750 [Candidatus Moraniibacteriota bacterium]
MKNQTKKTKEKVYTMEEVGSLLESMDGTMKMMSENYVGLVKTQDKILAVQYDMKNQLERVEIRLSGVEGRLDGVEQRLEKVETKIDRLQDDMVEVKFELKKKVSTDDFEKLEKRVVKLENLSYSH